MLTREDIERIIENSIKEKLWVEVVANYNEDDSIRTVNIYYDDTLISNASFSVRT